MSVSSLQYINKNIKTIGKSLMRINELLTEETLDELSLAQVGKGVGNVIKKTSSAIQGAKGAWQGAKDAYNQGKQSGSYTAARNAVGGGAPATNNQQNSAGQGTDHGLGQHSDGAFVQPGDKFDHETGQPLPNPQANNQQSQQQSTPAANQQQNQQQQSTPADNQQQQQTQVAGGAMKADAIAGELKGVWDKATADQGSATGDGKVKQQIIAMAKDAGMTGMKIESVGYSRFLGMEL